MAQQNHCSLVLLKNQCKGLAIQFYILAVDPGLFNFLDEEEESMNLDQQKYIQERLADQTEIDYAYLVHHHLYSLCELNRCMEVLDLTTSLK